MRRISSVTLHWISNGRSLTNNFAKSLSTTAPTGDNATETMDDFESRIFGSQGSSDLNPLMRALDKVERRRNNFGTMDSLDESFNTLSDGLEGELKKAATYFEFDPEEVQTNDYSFRPDIKLVPTQTYDVKDLDIRKPGVRRPPSNLQFSVTTEEVLKKADFRNVRFLAKFLTEAGIIVKRSQTGISAKAQRKLAREIKTARAFGLMPFTTMGTKSFVFGKSMENLDEDFQYEAYNTVDDADEKDI